MKVSDEKIIAAIMQHGTIKEAAAALEISPRTIYNRADDRNFRAAYGRAKDDLLRGAVLSMSKKLSAAVDTVFGIMNDTENSPDVRLRAAQTIIANTGRLSERLHTDEVASREETLSTYDLAKQIDLL